MSGGTHGSIVQSVWGDRQHSDNGIIIAIGVSGKLKHNNYYSNYKVNKLIMMLTDS